VVWVRSLVPKLKNSGFLGHGTGGEGGAGDLDHGADHVLQVLQAGLAENFLGHLDHDLLLVLKFLDAADERDHTSGMTFTPFLATWTTASKTARALHLGDLGIGDAETAAAVAQHGVELVQFLDALEQRREHGLEVLDLGAEALVGGGQFPLLLDIGVRRMALSTIRSSRLGRNSWSGGSRVRMTTGNPSMAVKRPAKSRRCMGRSLASALRRVFKSRARIMACMWGMRSSAKNMCSCGTGRCLRRRTAGRFWHRGGCRRWRARRTCRGIRRPIP